MPQTTALVAFVKNPEPGKVKTRLAVHLGDQLAAAVYEYFVQVILSHLEQIDHMDVYAAFSPPESLQSLKSRFPYAVNWFPQHESPDLGLRIHGALNEVLRNGHSRAIAIGTDSPTLPVAYLERAAQMLDQVDLVFGPAEDGGYYLIGVKTAPIELFQGIEWSTGTVLESSLRKAERLGMRFHLLPEWYDVDQVPELRKAMAEMSWPDALQNALDSALKKY